jgi:hypothetical protein
MKASVRFLSLAALVIALDASASVGIVPTQFATIQAAIDAPRDTVYVRAGTYEESVNITHPLFLSWISTDFPASIPRVRRLLSASGLSGNVSVEGFHFLGGASVSVGSGGSCTVEMCRADSGLTGVAGGGGTVHVSGCIVFGNLNMTGALSQAFMNTVVGGTLNSVTGAIGASPFNCNYVTGPAAVGIRVFSDEYATDNLVRNCVDGIHTGCNDMSAVNNVVEDCSGSGIVGPPCSSVSNNLYASNTVRRCGVSGIVVTGTYVVVDGNSVEDSGSDGIVINATTDHADNNHVTRAGGNGISGGHFTGHLRGNVVTRCTGDGINVSFATKIDHNVVGHNGGRGIVVANDNGNDVLRSNTSYNNNGPGYEISTTDANLDSVANNIGFGNSVGMRRNGAGAVVLTCNDWFGNPGGATSGVPVGITDVVLDPRFCNSHADIVTLAQTSPLLSLAGCGLVGALGLGCSSPVAVDLGGGIGPRPLIVYPEPSQGAVRFAWPELRHADRLEIYDAQGALRWSADAAAGSRGLTWHPRQAGSVPPGIYFARLRDRPELGGSRVTIVN